MMISAVRWDMTVAVEAIYEDGVLKLERPVHFKEHAKVRVTIEEHAAPQVAEDDDPTIPEGTQEPCRDRQGFSL
jgi:predicted DNA-binding antitoxin AbrB/MazE fold protein